jgi:Tfp pilus assembly protein PilF
VEKPLLKRRPFSSLLSTQTLLISLFLIVATLLVFWQVRNHDFLNFDDNLYVTQNPHVRAGLTADGIAWAFKDSSTGTWHPLTWLSLMLDSQLYGINPGAFHLTGLFFHVVNALLVFLVFFRMTGARLRSGFVAALFALHPLHVESVSWIAERKDVLSTFFWLLTMWTYIRYVEKPGIFRYAFMLLFFVLGLLAKPMLVTLPFVLLLVDYWPLCRIQKNSSLRISRLVLEKIPLIALAGISSGLTFFYQRASGAMSSSEILTFSRRAANSTVSYVDYIDKMFWPVNLSVFYPFPVTIPVWKLTASLLFLVCMSFIVIRQARRAPWFPVGWFWYLGTLVPVIGLVQVGAQAQADRYTYVPLIGLFVVIAWGLPDLLPRRWISERYARAVLPILVIGFFSFLIFISRSQAQYWQNSVTLFEHALDVTTDNAVAHDQLGIVLCGEGKTEEGVTNFNEALRINPAFTDAHINLGNALVTQGKIQEAISHYTFALNIYPNDATAQNDLANALISTGKVQDAITHYLEAIRLKDDYMDAHANLGLALAGQGKIQDAIEQYAIALKINPEAAAPHLNLGFAYLAIGNQSAALEQYKILEKQDAEIAKMLYAKIQK